MSNIGIKTSTVLILIAVLAFSRLIPHPPNFTPLLGMAVFAGARLDSKLFAILAPLTAMFLSDLIIGLHSGMSIIYFAILVNVFFGFYLKDRLGPLLIGGTLISGAIIFFLITNSYAGNPTKVGFVYLHSKEDFGWTMAHEIGKQMVDLVHQLSGRHIVYVLELSLIHI